jgi:phenylacetic acid degradation operon negative regulatory protein
MSKPLPTTPVPPAKASPLQKIVRTALGEAQPRAKSLIVTLFGDGLLPHGGSIWMGSLVALMAPLGINERLARTAVLRLTRDEWLESESVGRRSYYRLTEVGRRRFEEAQRRIYAAGPSPWDGRWSLVLLNSANVSAEQRDRIRRDLGWLGFAALSPGVLLHPNPDRAGMIEAIRDDVGTDAVLLLRAESEELPGAAGNPQRLRPLVASCWDLSAVSNQYQLFLDRFRPVVRAVSEAADPDPESCFLLRTLAIHEFRRVLLKDPDLPPELLPENWPGSTARQLCRNLYLLTEAAAERHLLAVAETADGPLPPASAYYYERFGGLRSELG